MTSDSPTTPDWFLTSWKQRVQYNVQCDLEFIDPPNDVGFHNTNDPAATPILQNLGVPSPLKESLPPSPLSVVNQEFTEFEEAGLTGQYHHKQTEKSDNSSTKENVSEKNSKCKTMIQMLTENPPSNVETNDILADPDWSVGTMVNFVKFGKPHTSPILDVDGDTVTVGIADEDNSEDTEPRQIKVKVHMKHLSTASFVGQNACATEEEKKEIVREDEHRGISGGYYSPTRRLSRLGISVEQMGDNVGKVLMWENMCLVLGFAPHIGVFLMTGVWYLNPLQRAMRNPGQKYISVHVALGLTLAFCIILQAISIKFGSFGGTLRKAHQFMGNYIIPVVAASFLLASILAELQLPGSIPQKIGRNLLTIWVLIVLYFMLSSAWSRKIEAHLHYLVVFWGLCVSAGALRGMAVFIGWAADCDYGWAVNPIPGVMVGTFLSTFLPMLWFVKMNGTWHKRYAKIAIFLSAYYQLLMPIYWKILFDPCKPRMNYNLIYKDYPFTPPEQFRVNHTMLDTIQNTLATILINAAKSLTEVAGYVSTEDIRIESLHNVMNEITASLFL